MIDLYTWETPNGRKISIMLEALGLEYKVHEINIGSGEQFEPAFSTISPNHKIPALVDSEGPDGKPIQLFESGAILIYLAEKYERYLPNNVQPRMDVMQWLMWQMGGFGPMLGQAHHFNFFVKEKVPYALERYNKEAQRLWQVLNDRLEGRVYVCDELSIADFAIYPWATRYPRQNVDPEKFPEVKRWMNNMNEHDFVLKGMLVPGDG